MWSGASRSTPINDKTDRKKPSAWRKGNRKTRRSVRAVSIAQSENFIGAPGRPDGDGRQASAASAESHSVTSPRSTNACSYAGQVPTRTCDLVSRSCGVPLRVRPIGCAPTPSHVRRVSGETPSREEADYSRKTNAPVWYKGCAHRPFATTEALAYRHAQTVLFPDLFDAPRRDAISNMRVPMAAPSC